MTVPLSGQEGRELWSDGQSRWERWGEGVRGETGTRDTFEARSGGQGVHVGGREAGPGVVGGREGEAVGWVECKGRGGGGGVHGIFGW